jgi:aldose sugar dehydrogenase
MSRTLLILCLVSLSAPAVLSQSVIQGFQLDTVLNPVAQGRAMAFAPDGRLFYTENATGRIMVVDDPTANPALPATEFATVSGLLAPSSDDMGLHGIVLHPNFPSDPSESTDRYIFVAHATGGSPQLVVKRFQEDVTNLGQALPGSETTLFSSVDMGSAGQNFGGRLMFDASGLLYVTVGDGGAAVSLAGTFAQDENDRRGKTLRYTATGSVPLANPLTGNAMYARGFRNPRGLAFNPNTLELFGTDTGNPATNGVGEMNVVRAGENYGWGPAGQSGAQSNPDFVDPAWEFSATFLPSSLAFYPPGVSGSPSFPAVGYRNGVVYAGSEASTGVVTRIVLTGSGERHGVAMWDLATGFPHPVRDVEFGPDGNLYVLTDGLLYRIGYVGNQSPNDPIANAGPDQEVDEGDPVTLNASASTDPDAGTILRYTWRQVGGSTLILLTNPTSITPTFTAPMVNFDQTFTFEVIVEDGSGGVDNDFVVITVRDTGSDGDDTPPTFEPPGEGGCSTGVHTGAWWWVAALGVLLLWRRRLPLARARL